MEDRQFSRSALFIGLTILLLAFFAMFTLLVRQNYLTQWDFDLLVKIQDKIPSRVYPMFSIVTILGSFVPTTLIIFIFSFFRRGFTNKITTAGLFFGMHLFEVIGKFFLDHKGPPFRFFREPTLFHFPLDYSVSDSYPSGHAMRSFFIAAVFTFYLWRSIRLSPVQKLIIVSASISLAFLISFGKVALGHHWLSDSVGGMFLGVACAVLSVCLTQRYPK